jgi:hypothetical protein
MQISTTHNLINPLVNGKTKLACKGPTLHIGQPSLLYNKKNKFLVKEEGVYVTMIGVGGTIDHKQLL